MICRTIRESTYVTSELAITGRGAPWLEGDCSTKQVRDMRDMRGKSPLRLTLVGQIVAATPQSTSNPRKVDEPAFLFRFSHP